VIELSGKYNTAKVFTDVLEETAVGQIILLCNQEFVSGSNIRIMPDVHAGAGCTIGFTMNITDKVCPNLVGVDIGCGMLTVNLGKEEIDFQKLDDIIRKYIPFGTNVHECRILRFDLTQLKCHGNLKDTKRLERSIGTLGGGNHFIEVDVDSKGNKYLIIHSGSRNLGHQVATYYQKLAIELCSGKDKMFEEQDVMIKEYKEQGRKNEIQNKLKEIRSKYNNLFPSLPEALCYLNDKYKDDYLYDMNVCQEFAEVNRLQIADIIINHMYKQSILEYSYFQTIHNYIDFKNNILRKGAISANRDETLLIPINMRDGCILGKGKGNEEWNWSAPHGAGRLMSRGKAKEALSLDDFKESMNGIFTTSVSQSTLDEAPMAYKSIDSIINNIDDTVDIIDIIKPVYNFKASE
jgi:tRNA-splicing ligase RtcB